MQAIILAAGMGKRLKDLTHDNTKCMIKVNGVTLIERLLRQLEGLNLKRIVVVVGYKGDKLIEFIKTLKINTQMEFIDNPVYDKTNNIYSLALAKNCLCEDDTLLFESDLIVEDGVIKDLVDDPRETLALVDKYESWMDGTCVKLTESDGIAAFVPGKKFKFDEIESYYKTVNIYKFSRDFSSTHYVPFLEAYLDAMGKNEYYEQVLKIITMLDEPVIKAKRVNGGKWYEIDDIQDLDIAQSIFTDDKSKFESIKHRGGGYWRYPKMTDFCNPANPYFPPQKLIDEIKASFQTLLTQYPSGMRVNSLVAAKNFGVHQENIVVGNSAAQLIKSLISNIGGSVGIVGNAFEEYANKNGQPLQQMFVPENDDLSYSAEDLIKFYEGKEINSLILVNPDRNTGNFIGTEGLCKIAKWTADKSIKLIVDESFADFADGENNSLITPCFIEKYPHLCIVKSISDSYGVAGLSLCVAVSGDGQLISSLKEEVCERSINSFAEFFMQITEKYRKDYLSGLSLFRDERKRFKKELDVIKNLRVINSQADFFMVEVYSMAASALAEKLLAKYNILIKDVSDKVGKRHNNFIRIAIKDGEDNNRLVNALKDILGG